MNTKITASAGAAAAPAVVLIGPMGSGKSTAAAYLAQLGAAVIDADAVAHQLLAKGGR